MRACHRHSDVNQKGLARVKAHSLEPQQFKQINRLLFISFALLSSFALLNAIFS